MAVQCGIIGLPNVGKSSLFNALTEAAIAAENYPFCTIEPNVGVVPLADERLAQLAAIANSAQVVAASVRLVDIAGLVSGASKGEGLGNQFLANIREVDGLVHVLRCFTDPTVVHVADRVDPVEDAKTVEIELALADLATVEKGKARLARQVRSGDKEAVAQVTLLDTVGQGLDDGVGVRSQGLSTAELAQLSELCLLTAKPVLYCANLGEDERPQDSAAYQAVVELAHQADAGVLAVCARIEAELVALAVEERAEMLAALGWAESGIARLARAAYTLLGLQTFFTVGPKESRAWEYRHGTVAAAAAGIIHTDMQRGFIRAETISTADYLSHGGEAGCRDAGKLRLEGRDYVVQDGDVMHFRFNV